MSLQPYGSADFDLGRYLKLIVEVDAEPPHVHVGLLAWAWGRSGSRWTPRSPR